MYSIPNLEPVHCSMSGSNCCFLTCIQISQEAGNVVWYSHLFKNFPQFRPLKGNTILSTICSHFKDEDTDSGRRCNLPKLTKSASHTWSTPPPYAYSLCQVAFPLLHCLLSARPPMIFLFKTAASPTSLPCVIFFIALTTF